MNSSRRKNARCADAGPGKYLLLFLLISSTLVPLCGCHKNRHPVAQAVLRYPLNSELSTLDPARIQDIFTTELLQNVYVGLVTFNEKSIVTPALAERWEISPDGKTYTFHLRPNARFHRPIDSPVTANDVKYSLERALWPETRSPTAASYLAGIVGIDEVLASRRKDLAGVEVLDAHTLTITLDKPRGYFLGVLTYCPAWVVCKAAIDGNKGRLDEKAAIGAGPFILRECHPGERVVLEANTDFYGGKPPLDRIIRPIVLDRMTSHIQYENGEIDSCLPSAVSYVRDKANPKLVAECRALPQAGFSFLVLQQHKQREFAIKEVRLAIAQAIDKDMISRIAYNGVNPRADGILPPGVSGSYTVRNPLRYDPPTARRRLASAGYPNGRGFPELTLVTIQTEGESRAAAQLIAKDLKTNLGITVHVREQEATTFFKETMDDEKIGFYITAWIADYLDPQDFLSTLLRSGSKLSHTGYHSTEFDDLCDLADSQTEKDKRIPEYERANQIATGDAAIVPLVFSSQPILVKPYVKDWSSNLLVFMLPHTHTRIQR